MNKLNRFEMVLKKELDSASKSPYDEWSKSLLRLRDAYDEVRK